MYLPFGELPGQVVHRNRSLLKLIFTLLHSFICSFALSFIRSFIHSSIHSFSQSVSINLFVFFTTRPEGETHKLNCHMLSFCQPISHVINFKYLPISKSSPYVDVFSAPFFVLLYDLTLLFRLVNSLR